MATLAHPFDADTALEPAGERRRRAVVPAHRLVGRGANGGFPAAVAARAAEAAAGRPLRSLALHFLAAPAAGPLDVAAPTLDLTIHIRRPLPPAGMGPGDHLLARFGTRLGVGGVWEEDGELWTPGGELLAQSRRLALARELPE